MDSVIISVIMMNVVAPLQLFKLVRAQIWILKNLCKFLMFIIMRLKYPNLLDKFSRRFQVPNQNFTGYLIYSVLFSFSVDP
jgi:hypothetical protein